MEGGDRDPSEIPSPPDQTFFVSPVKVNLLIGESQPFCAFDLDGKTLTAQAEWAISSRPFVATLTTSAGPFVTAKGTGTFTVEARMGGRVAEAEVTVLSGSSLAPGTVRWSAPSIRGFKIKQAAPAVPHANGPDIYLLEGNGAGERLIRALTSDGLRLRMRKSAPPVKGSLLAVAELLPEAPAQAADGCPGIGPYRRNEFL